MNGKSIGAGFLVSLMGLALSGGLAAQEDEFAGDGLYARVGAGIAFPGDLNQSFVYNPNMAFVGLLPTAQTVDLEQTYSLAVALGFDYADGIRTELEYRHEDADVESVTPLFGGAAGVATNPDESYTVHVLMGNFYFDFYNDSAFTPFIGGGVGGVFASNDTAGKDAALAYQARAGVALEMSETTSFVLEYVYARSRDLVFGPNDDDFLDGDMRPFRIDGAPYQTSSALASVQVKF